jgi:hypothetical protein
MRLKAAAHNRKIDLLVLNAGGGNKGVLAIGHRAGSALTRVWNAHTKLQTA